MRSFQQFIEDTFEERPDDVIKLITAARNRIIDMEPKELTDYRGLLIQVKKVIDEKLSGIETHDNFEEPENEEKPTY